MLHAPQNQSTLRIAIERYNSQFNGLIDQFQKNNSQVIIWTYRAYDNMNTILANPTAYGFLDATSYGNQTNLFWWDPTHLSCEFWETRR